MKQVLGLLVLSVLLPMSLGQLEAEWNRTYGGTGWESALCVAGTGDGGYILGGRTEPFGGGNVDAWLVKTDSEGNEVWNQTYGGKEPEYAECILETGDGGYILAGMTESFGAGSSDAWLVRIDSEGNEVWNQTYGGTGSESAYRVLETSDGGYILAGMTESFGAGASDAWLVKICGQQTGHRVPPGVTGFVWLIGILVAGGIVYCCKKWAARRPQEETPAHLANHREWLRRMRSTG